MILQVGVKVFIQNQKNQYLLIKRSKRLGSSRQNFWDIPGGRIDPSENLYDALKREVHEETGLELVEQLDLINAQDIFNAKEEIHVVRITYRAAATGQLVLSSEHSEYCWLNREQIEDLSDLDPYLKESLERSPLIGGKTYRHTKSGKLYQLVDTAKHTETGEPLAIYRPLYRCLDAKLFARPQEMFFDKVNIDGDQVSRFEEVMK